MQVAIALTAQDPPLRTQIWFTVDEAAFPVPPPGKAQFPHNAKVQNVIKLVTDGVDGLVRRDAPEDRGERRWDMEVDARECLVEEGRRAMTRPCVQHRQQQCNH